LPYMRPVALSVRKQGRSRAAAHGPETGI